MAPLPRTDAEKLLAFVGDARAADGPEPFTTDLLDRLAAVVECEFATYYQHDLSDLLVASVYVPCSHEAQYAVLPHSVQTADAEQGVASGRWNSSGLHAVRMWSDTYRRDVRRRFEVTPTARYYQTVDSAWMLFSVGPFEQCVLALHHQERDFTERDRRKLLALRPHVATLIRDARARRRLTDLAAVVDTASEDDPRGIVLLGTRFDIEYSSPAARRILVRWFGGLEPRVPPALEDWLRSRAPMEPLRVERGGLRLVVEAPTTRALLLTEESLPPAGLTSKESEVLRCLAAGMSTAEIARVLWVTQATVSKHLEHIYRKLGVTSRTAALAAVATTTRGLEHGMPAPTPRHTNRPAA